MHVNTILHYYMCKVNLHVKRKCQITGKNKSKYCTTTPTIDFGDTLFSLTDSMFLFT